MRTIKVQLKAPVVFNPSSRFWAGAVRHCFENRSLRNIAEQCLDRGQRIFVVCKHSSAHLGYRKLVCEDIVEERGPGTVGEVLVEFPEMRDERLRGDNERTHLQLMRQHRHRSTVRGTDGVRNPFCSRESRGGIAQLLKNRVAGLQLKFVQCRPDGAFRRVTCVSFRERRCLNAANLGPHQDPNVSDNCAIQQVAWHVMIGHSAQFTPVLPAIAETTPSARGPTTSFFMCIESDCIVGNFGARQHPPPLHELMVTHLDTMTTVGEMQ